ncbi:DUF1836 domain-containing protein [uncultured Eubacterium sp.]|uniref:DUF1836 domain-containing protein n=1 Tax=uncultured Eubacterium sp. TaxID=165185 RepID=UPI0026721FB4|nr:DUF1836 domain-containing protein [uncultured Eubacterium sp.]
MNSEEIIKQILNEIQNFNINDLPNIDLYMDQVTTYLNNKFSATKRYEEDKLLTKTMINNYAKSRLLPPPEKKKYSKDHIIVLIMIYFFKNVISINDVTKILTPMLDNYFHNENMPLENIINKFLEYIHGQNLSEPILNEILNSDQIFDNIKVNDEDKDYLQTLGIITLLSYDMFLRKIMIEKLIDSLPDKEEDKK